MIRQAGITGTLLILIFTSSPAWAGHEGLSYTARGGASFQTREDGKQMHTITYTAPKGLEEKTETGANLAKDGKDAADETPASRVWKKYKNLAAGISGEEEGGTIKETATDAGQPAQEESPPPAGFAAILQEYQKSKQARSEMKTLVITKPEKPEAPKEPEQPEAEKPTKE